MHILANPYLERTKSNPDSCMHKYRVSLGELYDKKEQKNMFLSAGNYKGTFQHCTLKYIHETFFW